MAKSTEDLIREIGETLKVRPLEALGIYEDQVARKTSAAPRLVEIFKSTMEYAASGRDISRQELLKNAPRLFGSPRQSDRQLLVAVAAEQLVILGKQGQTEVLEGIGEAFEALVLDGTQQQQLCGRIAVELGQHTKEEVLPLWDSVVTPLIRSLRIVLRVGAVTTRDSAVEGLGGLMKFKFDETDFPSAVQPVVEHEKEDESAAKINRLYFERMKRRRLMVFAVAGHRRSRIEFYCKLREPIAITIAKIRDGEPTSKQLRELLLDTLYGRADYLRTLPALVRQSEQSERKKVYRRAIRFLRDAAGLRSIGEDDEAILIAFAHYQESVFRTIDVMIKREATHDDFGDVLTAAVEVIPRTLVGRAALCNAQVRATFALIRTAARLIRDDRRSSSTKDALVPLFADLGKPSPWPNLGIAEGCYFVLPFLLENKVHEKLCTPALDALFQRLDDPPAFGDLARTHAQLIATTCFRRMILLLMQRAEEHTNAAMSLVAERDVRKLLLQPNTSHVLQVFQNRSGWSSTSTVPSQWTAGIVIAGAAFENNLLERSSAMFRSYEGRPSVERLLLTRILAAQLRAASQDAREIARSALLSRLYDNMPTVSIDARERNRMAQKLLGAIPPRTAEAADADLQDFLEHCGQGEGPREEDLPAHVLAMISDKPGERIADAIAREIHLNLKHWRKRSAAAKLTGETAPDFDFGKPLYQVMLRGPHEMIFDYLLPRMTDDRDRRMVALFRRHVASVRGNPAMEPEDMLQHVDNLLEELRTSKSETLQELHRVLQLYRSLFADEAGIWDAFARERKVGGLGELFQELDGLATKAHITGSKNVLRKPLFDTFKEAAAEVRAAAQQYYELPIGKFKARAKALQRASAAAKQIETALLKHDGLLPPERVMLISLMQRLQDFFARTERWFCDEPLRRQQARKKKRDPEMFFNLFASPDRPFSEEFRVAAPIEKQKMAKRARAEWLHVAGSNREFPAEFPGQRARFEQFFVDWMASELDVDMLKSQLSERWSPLFRAGYAVMTNFWLISAAILLPCVVAAVLHYQNRHDEEGAGFLLLEILVVITVILSLMPWLRQRALWLWSKVMRREPPKEERLKPLYREESIIPRLTRLIAVPLALTVELEHAYTFPMHASTSVLVLLIALSFLTTKFFVDREIVDPSEPREEPRASERAHVKQVVAAGDREIVDPSEHREEPRASERVRVKQVVAVALTHAFITAVLFATIFGSHAAHVPSQRHEPPPEQHWTGIAKLVDTLARHVDEPAHGGHHGEHPLFAGVLPRDVRFDTKKFVERFGRTLPNGFASHVDFTFYPTLILTWTALGLFVGLFLEGFVEGKRLRGEAKDEPEPDE